LLPGQDGGETDLKMNLVVKGGFLGWSVPQSDAEGVGMYPKTGWRTTMTPTKNGRYCA